MDNNIQQDVVNFYQPQGQNGWFSNCYPSPFQQNGVKYPTNQHFFQSKKFQGTDHEKYIRSAATPYEAFDRGNERVCPLRPDWAEVKEQIMYTGLQLKFTQNQDIKQRLLETGNKTIIEHTVNDSFWGDGGDGKGGNRLGILLMKLREEIKNKQ